MKQTLQANGVDLCVETFGDPTAPAILLIAGAASSMDWWEDEFCDRLAAGGRFVIRYDLRDTGQSTTDEPGAPRYGGLDLVADAIGVLDALDVSRAHLVGISMGGGLAQRLVLDHPDRAASLTLISTSGGGSGLPPMSDELAAVFAEPQAEPDWSNRAAVVAYIVEGQGPFSGSVRMDEASLRNLVEQVVDRATNIASSMTNHWILDEGEPARAGLGEITTPTLVLHGTEDPLFPYGHGEALAAEIPGARLIPLVGVGHEMPPRATWDVVVPAILEHTEPAEVRGRGFGRGGAGILPSMTDFTLKNLGDVEDMAVQGGFSEFQEARFAGKDLGLDTLGVSYQVVKPGKHHAFGHRHEQAVEVYVVLSGTGVLRLDDDEVGVERLDAIRVGPTVTRGFEAGSDGLELLVFSERMPGDAEIVADFFDA